MTAVGGQHPNVVARGAIHAGGRNAAGSASKFGGATKTAAPAPTGSTFNPATGWTHAGAPAVVAPTAPPAPQTAQQALALDPNALHDSTWNAQTAGLNYDLQNQKDALTKEASGLDSQFAAADAARRRWYSQDTEASNANLAARGIFSSGSRDQAFTDRNAQDTTQRTSIDNSYGTARKNAIVQALNDLATRQSLGQQGIDAEARDRFVQNFPAPQGLAGAVNPIAAAVAAAPKPPKPSVAAGGASKGGSRAGGGGKFAGAGKGGKRR